MKIILNNTPREFEQESLTISELLNVCQFSFKMLVIKVNGQVIRRHEYDSTVVKDGDDVAVIHLISGG